MSPSHSMNLTPDDPRLTAYALGELEGDELLAVESAVAADADLKQAVEDIRSTADQLTSALETEPIPVVTPAPITPYRPEPAVTSLAYWISGGLAAAIFAMLFVLVRSPSTQNDAEERPRLVRVDQISVSRSNALDVEGGSDAASEEARDATEDTNNEPAASDDADDIRTESAVAADPSSGRVNAPARSPGRDAPPAVSNRQATDEIDAFVLNDSEVPLPAAPGTAGTPSPGSLLALGDDDVPAFDAAFAVRTPAEEMTATGGRLVDSRRVFTSEPDVASNLATAIDAADGADEQPDRNSTFVYDRNRQNVSLRSTLVEARRSQPAAQSEASAADTVPPPSDGNTGTLEPTPEESLRSLVGESLQHAVGIRLPGETSAGESTRFAYDASAYQDVEDNDFLAAEAYPLSTVPIDVDSASYANVRRFLASNQRPPRGAVRIEEMLNYFDYDYVAPNPDSEATFATAFEVTEAPWNNRHRLVRVGLKSRELRASQRPATNLVVLVDVSGSMEAPDKLPLVKTALQMLVDQLAPTDRLALVAFSTRAGVLLRSTPASDRPAIERAIDALTISAGDDHASGMVLAYGIAAANFISGGINRVVVFTDGDPNSEPRSPAEFERLMAARNRTGIALTVLGFGMSADAEQSLGELARGHGAAFARVDSPREARSAMAGSAFFGNEVVARDVRLQVEFNPAKVQAYRMLGYENSRLPQAVSSGGETALTDVGPGEAITALYEVVPADVPWNPPQTMADRWIEIERNRTSTVPLPPFRELLTVKMRFAGPDGAIGAPVEYPLFDDSRSFVSASTDFKFAASVAAFGMVMRDSPHRGSASLDQIMSWAGQGIGADDGGHRGEFIAMVRQAQRVLP